MTNSDNLFPIIDKMDELATDKNYTDFIENLIEQVHSLCFLRDVNELQKVTLSTKYLRKSATLMAAMSIQENMKNSEFGFDNQCFFIFKSYEMVFLQNRHISFRNPCKILERRYAKNLACDVGSYVCLCKK